MKQLFMNSSITTSAWLMFHIFPTLLLSPGSERSREGKKESNILALAGGGFESTVRLAKSNAETWAPIFCENAVPIIEVIDTYIEKMNRFKILISEKDTNGLKELMEEANKIRKILH